MKQRLACMILVDLRDGLGRPSIEDTASLLLSTGIVASSRRNAIDTVKQMIDKGHRYRNLHQNICPGLALVLGIALPEHWYAYREMIRCLANRSTAGPRLKAVKCSRQFGIKWIFSTSSRLLRSTPFCNRESLTRSFLDCSDLSSPFSRVQQTLIICSRLVLYTRNIWLSWKLEESSAVLRGTKSRP